MTTTTQSESVSSPLSITKKKRRPSRKEQKERKRQRQKQQRESRQQHVVTKNVSEQQQQQPTIQMSESDLKRWVQEWYTPTPLPTESKTPATTTGGRTNKWFPKAVVCKPSKRSQSSSSSSSSSQQPSSAPPKASIVLFYQYVDAAQQEQHKDKSPDNTTVSSNPLQWSDTKVQQLMDYVPLLVTKYDLGGRIRVAKEGVNATISSIDTTPTSTDNHSHSAKVKLRCFTKDLQHFDPVVFGKTDFKFVDDLSEDRHFRQCQIFPVQELVYYGFEDGTNEQRQAQQKAATLQAPGGIHLPPQAFHQKLQQDETVVIDVRNHYEAAIGRFDGQTIQSESSDKQDSLSSSNTAKGAIYLDPKMRKSTDFATWLEQPSTQTQLANKQILMYCTGGVRCERASKYLQHTLQQHDVATKGVYQLQGGIEAYMKEFNAQTGHADGGFWRGKNFVFDKREAVSVDNFNGDGGVIRKQHDKKNTTTNQTNDTSNSISTYCCICSTPWDRYVGKKKCTTCGVPVLMCDKCMSSRNHKNTSNKNDHALQQRCPLCVEQNVTVLLEHVELTDNGKRSRAIVVPPRKRSDVVQDSDSHDTRGDLVESFNSCGKVAPSVLKWGGGHATRKKHARKVRQCRFGSACTRPDCFFQHDNRGNTSAPKL